MPLGIYHIFFYAQRAQCDALIELNMIPDNTSLSYDQAGSMIDV